MLNVVLPVVLFVITLIIILAFRAEDKKSRSLQTVKEKISLFRSESQQTMARINETAKDAEERVDATKKEANALIADVNASLASLSNHKNDLMALESICRGYEMALEKLRLQTEHAEDRIRLVQNEVEKAGQVNALIESFHAETERVKAELDEMSASCSALVQKTGEELDAVAENHKAKADEMLMQFSDMLSRNREEFGSFIDEVRTDIDSRHEQFKSFLDSSYATLEIRKEDVIGQTDEALGRFADDKSSLEALLETSKTGLSDLASQLDERHEEILKKVEEASLELDQSVAKRKEEAKAEFDELSAGLETAGQALRLSASEEKTKLDEHAASARQDLTTFIEDLSARMDAFEERRNEIEKDVENLKLSGDESYENFKTKLDELASTSQTSLSARIVEGEDNITKLAEDLKSRFADDSGAIFRKLEDARSSLASVHEQQAALIKEENERYSSLCREDLAKAMDAEISRVSAVFDKMMNASTEQLGNFAKKLTEIKEAVSMLNQGVNESLNRGSEKLTQIQSRMAASEAGLSEAQNKVTVAKEELFNLQKEHRSLSEEVSRAQKELEWLQGQAAKAKRDRQTEEARLVKMQLSSASKEEKKAPVKEEFEGEEENFPIDEE